MTNSYITLGKLRLLSNKDQGSLWPDQWHEYNSILGLLVPAALIKLLWLSHSECRTCLIIILWWPSCFKTLQVNAILYDFLPSSNPYFSSHFGIMSFLLLSHSGGDSGPCRHGVYPEFPEADALICACWSTGCLLGCYRKKGLAEQEVTSIYAYLEPGCVFNLMVVLLIMPLSPFLLKTESEK